MSEPYIFLDSPRVGGEGHSYLVAPGSAQRPESELIHLASAARRSDAQSADVLAAGWRVEQLSRGMTRSGEEFLICGGAQPVHAGDAARVREILASLLAMLPAPTGRIEPGKRMGPLVFEADFMAEIEGKFQSDARKSGITWQTILPERIANVKKPGWIRKNRMKFVLGTIVVLAGAFWLPFQIWSPSSKLPAVSGKTASPSSSSSKGAWESWNFLLQDDWPRLQKATGGSTLNSRLREWNQRPKSEKSAGLPQETALEIQAWAETLAEEFKVGASNAKFISKEKIFGAIMSAKDKDGNSVAAAWFQERKDQRENLDPKTRSDAVKLDEFSKLADPPVPTELHNKIVRLWNALEAFSRREKVKTNSEIESFRDEITQKLKNARVSVPPPEYTIATPLDADRLAIIREILGGKKVGLVLAATEYSKERSNWMDIRNQIGKSGKPEEEWKSDQPGRFELVDTLKAEFPKQAQ